MPQAATVLGLVAQPYTIISGAIAEFWAERAQNYWCSHCEAENRIQLELAECGNVDDARRLLRLTRFGPAARAYLHHHKILTDISAHIKSTQLTEVAELRQFVLNFLYVEHALLGLMHITYHRWIEDGHRDRLSQILQEDADFYASVAILHAVSIDRTEALNTLCQRLQTVFSTDG
jgi:thiol-disulfide isomerase/thioredoxin